MNPVCAAVAVYEFLIIVLNVFTAAAVFDASVTRPYTSTVTIGVCPLPPYVPAVTPEGAKPRTTLPVDELEVIKLLLTIYVPCGILIVVFEIAVMRP